MAAQWSRRLLGCFVLVHYSESLKDLTQAGHPPAAGLVWGWELCAGRSGHQQPASYGHLLEAQKKGQGDVLIFDGGKYEILPNCFLAFLPVWGQRDVETSKK